VTAKVRPWKKNGKTGWEYDLRFALPDGREVRERRKSDLSGRLATVRFAEARERELYNAAVSAPAPAVPPSEPTKPPEKPSSSSVRELSKRFLEFPEGHRSGPQRGQDPRSSFDGPPGGSPPSPG
jgi:hypothetical protein